MKTIILIGGLFVAAPAFAQEAPQPDAASDTASDDTVVVVANRSPVAADRVAASVTVLDKAAIDRAQDLGIAELLVRTPGVTLSRNGGYGTATSVRIRGAEGDQTVVVIDGVKLNDPASTGGGYNFGNLLVGDAARVEVLRGPQSILWGSQAIGGVVNIVTPLPERALEANFDVEAGSRDTVSGRAALGGTAGSLAWRVGGQAFTTDGISAIAPAFGGVETDGYTNRSVTGRAVLTLAPGVSVEGRGYYSDARVETDTFDGDSFEYSTTRDFVGYAGLNVDLFDGRLRNRFAYGYTDTKRDNYDPDQAPSKTFAAVGRNERLEYQGTAVIAKDVDAVFGVENEVSRFRSLSSFSTTPSRGRAELTGVYGQLNATVAAGLTLTAGVRHDDHDRFGSKTLFAGGGVWALPIGTTIRASYSEGFKAPTLYQLFSEYGNDALDPERAKGWEAGAEQRFLGGKASLGAAYFERRSRGLIDFASCFGPTTDPLCLVPGTMQQRFGYYLNVARAFARGVEASGRVALAQRVSVDGNYTWTLSEDRSDGSSNLGKQLPRRPQHAANASVSYTVPDSVSFGAAVRYSGATVDNAFDRTRLGAYTLVDLRAELPLSPTVRVFARAENVFDEDYATASGYGTLGRSIYAGFRGRF